MKSDVPSNAPPPPAPTPAVPTAPPFATVRSWSADDICRALDEFVRRVKTHLPFDPAADGSAGIPSLIAAWLLTEVGKDIGLAKSPVNLAAVKDRNDLRSVAGVARLLHREFHPVRQAAAS